MTTATELLYGSLPQLADAIAHTAHRRVGLQFPDDRLGDALAVESQMHDHLAARGRHDVALFVLADASTSPCCVDEVAAKHADITLVVQFGHSCMTPPANVEVIRRFARRRVDANQIAHAIQEELSVDTPVVVFLAQDATHALQDVSTAVRATRVGNESSVSFATINVGGGDNDDDDDDESWHYANAFDGHVNSPDLRQLQDQRRPTLTERGGYSWRLPPRARDSQQVNYVWVGDEQSAHYVQLRLLYNRVPWHRVDLDDDPPLRLHRDDVGNAPRALRRRRFVMQRALEADIVAIVACVLGARGCRAEVERLRRRIAGTGRKTYVLSVGRVTPAKLANYAEVGAFVLVACPQTALLDDREYLRPVLTPFEAELAFLGGEDGAALWDGVSYAFQSPKEEGEEEEGGGGGGGEEGVRGDGNETGALLASELAQPRAREAPLTLSAARHVSAPTATTAAEYLKSVRTWSGMGSAMVANGDDNDDDDGRNKAPAHPRLGRRGRAAGYYGMDGGQQPPPTEDERRAHVARFLARARELAFFARPSAVRAAAVSAASEPRLALTGASGSDDVNVNVDALSEAVLACESSAYARWCAGACDGAREYVHDIALGMLRHLAHRPLMGDRLRSLV